MGSQRSRPGGSGPLGDRHGVEGDVTGRSGYLTRQAIESGRYDAEQIPPGARGYHVKWHRLALVSLEAVSVGDLSPTRIALVLHVKRALARKDERSQRLAVRIVVTAEQCGSDEVSIRVAVHVFVEETEARGARADAAWSPHGIRPRYGRKSNDDETRGRTMSWAGHRGGRSL